MLEITDLWDTDTFDKIRERAESFFLFSADGVKRRDYEDIDIFLAVNGEEDPFEPEPKTKISELCANHVGGDTPEIVDGCFVVYFNVFMHHRDRLTKTPIVVKTSGGEECLAHLALGDNVASAISIIAAMLGVDDLEEVRLFTEKNKNTRVELSRGTDGDDSLAKLGVAADSILYCKHTLTMAEWMFGSNRIQK